MQTEDEEDENAEVGISILLPVADIQSHQNLLKTVTYFVPRNMEYHVIYGFV